MGCRRALVDFARFEEGMILIEEVRRVLVE